MIQESGVIQKMRRSAAEYFSRKLSESKKTRVSLLSAKEKYFISGSRPIKRKPINEIEFMSEEKKLEACRFFILEKNNDYIY